MRVEYNGTDRFTLPGSLAYPGGYLPPLGTILGPNGYNEHVTVVAHRDGRAVVSLTTRPDIDAAREHGDPRSVVEQKMLAQR
jgi:hypothetical protein